MRDGKRENSVNYLIFVFHVPDPGTSFHVESLENPQNIPVSLFYTSSPDRSFGRNFPISRVSFRLPTFHSDYQKKGG